MGKERLPQLNKIVYFPLRLHIGFERIEKGILASRWPHTWGNPDTEILLGVDNPNKSLRNKGKEQLDIPLFGNSPTLEFHSFQDSVWENNFERSFVKSKFESDLKKTDINTSRLESYPLDSLWCNLHNSVEYEEINLVVQFF